MIALYNILQIKVKGECVMFGAFIGDIVGSKYEFNNIKTKRFPLFSQDCDYTDDTIMTVAVAKAIMLSRREQYEKNEKGKSFQEFLHYATLCVL